MNTIGLPTLLVLIGSAFLLNGCTGEFSGEGGADFSSAVGFCAAPATTSLAGQQQYTQQCASCHGNSGAGTTNGPSLIGCATCTDVATLTNRIATTMPIGSVGSCGVECATETAEYILESLSEAQLCGSEQVLEDIQVADSFATSFKASVSLASRLPSAAEVSQLEQMGDTALEGILDDIMEEDAFYVRLKEIFNDVLLQNKYLPGEDAINLLDSNDYPNRKWYNDLGLDAGVDEQRRLRDYLRDQSNDALAQEALELIAYVVRLERPFTEILTADYTLVNRFSAAVYGVENQANFATLSEPEFPQYPHDPADFQPVRIASIPHAGVLTSPMFLNRFPTTETNRNRHRARVLYDMFLDTDILQIQGARPDDAIDITSTTPTIDNPSCATCHRVMDPVASAFQNWDDRGRYRPSRLFDGWFTDMEQRGFNGTQMPLEGNLDSSLSWLAHEIKDDPRFARAVVKILYTGLTGKAPLQVPANVDDTSHPGVQAYLAQRAHLGNIETDFINANYNLKVAVKRLVLSPYYRAVGLHSGADTQLHAETGATRLLTPEMLDRKIEAVTGYRWLRDRGRDISWLQAQDTRGYNQLYGGIDSDNVTRRITDPNGLMVAVQERLSTEIACDVTTKDFFLPARERKLFPLVETDTAPEDDSGNADAAAQTAIQNNIAHLHWQLFGERVSATDAAVQTTYALFNEALAMGQQGIEDDSISENIHFRCDLNNHPISGESLPSEQQIRRDDRYLVRAWMAVLSYMLADVRFLYE